MLGCLLTAHKVVLFVFCFLLNINLHCCNVLIHVVSMTIVRSVLYHLCEKTLNKKGRRRRKFGNTTEVTGSGK